MTQIENTFENELDTKIESTSMPSSKATDVQEDIAKAEELFEVGHAASSQEADRNGTRQGRDRTFLEDELETRIKSTFEAELENTIEHACEAELEIKTE